MDFEEQSKVYSGFSSLLYLFFFFYFGVLETASTGVMANVTVPDCKGRV